MNDCKTVSSSSPLLHGQIEKLSEIRSALIAEIESTGNAANRLKRNEDPSKASELKLIDAVCFSTALDQEIQLLGVALQKLHAANVSLHDLI